MGNTLSLALSVAGPIAVGAGIGISIAPEIKGWYKTLKKPSWNPPNWLFGPTWTLLYGLMGVAAHRVWAAGGGPVPLGLYGAQLLMNFAWSPLFFKVKDLRLASLEITALLGVLGATIAEFHKVDPLAAKLLLPYLGWTSFATALTYNIWLNNPDQAAASAGVALHGAAAEATAAAANVFLAQGGEKQGDAVPPEAAAATAARGASTTSKED